MNTIIIASVALGLGFLIFAVVISGFAVYEEFKTAQRKPETTRKEHTDEYWRI